MSLDSVTPKLRMWTPTVRCPKLASNPQTKLLDLSPVTHQYRIKDTVALNLLTEVLRLIQP